MCMVYEAYWIYRIMILMLTWSSIKKSEGQNSFSHFRLMQVFSLRNNSFSGSLPASWGSAQTAFPALSVLSLDNNTLSGDLPTEWSGGWSKLSWVSTTTSLPLSRSLNKSYLVFMAAYNPCHVKRSCLLLTGPENWVYQRTSCVVAGVSVISDLHSI